MKIKLLIIFIFILLGCAVSKDEYKFDKKISKSIPEDVAIDYLRKNNTDANINGIVLYVGGLSSRNQRFNYKDLKIHVVRRIKYEIFIESISVPYTIHIIFCDDIDSVKKIIECLSALGLVV